MKRQIAELKTVVSGCCPGHDKYPDSKYKSNRSTKARAKFKRVEHKAARSILLRMMRSEFISEEAIHE